jgi:hypothetical protein
MRPRLPLLVPILAATSACSEAAEAQRAAQAVVEKAAPVIDGGKQAVEKGIERAQATGELSEASRRWLAEAAAGDDVESIIAKGVQLAPVALEVARVVDEAVDEDTTIEPIYQRAGDAQAQAELDARLARMPRTQEIEGVQVGFRRLSEVASDKKVDESAYLVVWRRGDHLVGFVYRSRREVDIDALVAETPRLMKLVDGVLGGAGG